MELKNIQKPMSVPVLSKNWNLRDLKLPRDEMLQAIAGAQFVPLDAKAMLKAMVSTIDDKISLMRLDAHCFGTPTHITMHLTVAKL